MLLLVIAIRQRNASSKEDNISPGHNYARRNSFIDKRQGTASESKEGAPHGQIGLWDNDAITAARVSRDKVRVGKLISRGAYGEVYAGVFNNEQVVVKMLPRASRKSIPHVNALLAEVKTAATMEHPRIVTFIGVAWDSLIDLCVVMEFMEGGDLRSLLNKYELSRHPVGFDRQKITIALHVCHGLTYMHSMAPVVIHRDLKSRNILLGSDHLEAKLTDFGISRERLNSTMTAGVGTSLWMAPEVMLGNKYDEKADIFSFGVVLSELDVHTLPSGVLTSSLVMTLPTCKDGVLEKKEDLEVKLKIARCYVQLNCIHEAIEVLKSTPLDKRSLSMNLLLGKLYVNEGLQNKAEESYTAALRQNPYALEAVVALTELAAAKDASPDAYCDLYAVGVNRYKEALATAKSVVKLFPQKAQSFVLFGSVLALSQEHRDQAQQVLQKALTMEPRKLSTNFALVDLLVGEGNLRDAIDRQVFSPWLQALGERYPRDEVFTKLAYVYSMDKQYAEALKYFHQALRLNPGSTEAMRGLDRLEKLMRGEDPDNLNNTMEQMEPEDPEDSVEASEYLSS
ncbi:hypothetical protein BBO99_00006705 [Phytophthora kernoviae]|uniref:Protein kinase domain-containing protein n=2 Tax=Phytophthora kernoviae TaxID=325452 RepID=A0A3R7J2P8_9STRA|nr:hypothetical protein G195_003121 [Phytophthora kernoviae 00238/432]KAG2526044.1 hypothetical protein JM16_002517 [Phytophthora kernoviae]KAG2527740.1 hypothetical protein JM18_002325 [Phytophthora kernoviae]RLN10996.1 hypothetical protein BBI17_000743 [Phytophthora kernoviae]RLN77483.1 hypothetical protein BBO99_00006705 [Phytophthora kernoviae]